MASVTTETTATEQSATVAPARSGFRPYQMTVDVYERIAGSGALGYKSKLILWKGQLVEKVSDMTKGRPHVTAVNNVLSLLSKLVDGEGYFVEQDQPIALAALKSMPEPDLKCVQGTIGDYAKRAPTAADCPLVAEVSDSSLADDSGEMLEVYAAASIPVYWIVNIPNNRIDVYTGPTGPSETPTYTEHQSYGPGDEVPVVLDGREVGRIAAGDVLP